MASNVEIGLKIKNRREEIGLTQRQLATKVGYTSPSSIAQIERGRINIPQSKLEALAVALMVDVSYLMDDDYTEAPPADFSRKRKFLFSKVKEGDEKDIALLYKLWEAVEESNKN